MSLPKFSILLESETFTFTARHFITYRIGNKDAEPITEPIHEHRFRIAAVISGPLDTEGLLIDFHRASLILSDILNRCRNKLFVALHQPGITITRPVPEQIEIRFRSESPETGETKEECLIIPADQTVLLDTINGSAEQIVLALAQLFRTQLEKEGAFLFPPENYCVTLTLEESPGMKASVTL